MVNYVSSLIDMLHRPSLSVLQEAVCLPGDEDTSVPSTSNVISVEKDDAFEMLQSTSEASSDTTRLIDVMVTQSTSAVTATRD